MNIGIIGLGLIGGSLARDLSNAGWRVAGSDADRASLAAAMDSGAVQAELADEPGELDLIVIAVPVRSALDVVRQIGERIPESAGTVVTDVGSTKRSVIEAAVGAGLGRRFVGGHPMAGDDRSGWATARSGLFRGAPVWLCPAPGAKDFAVRRVERLWAVVGGRTERIDPAAHDRRMAFASHLPQVTASALAAAMDAAGVAPGDLGPGGRDTTRLAGSDPDLWSDIVLDNCDELRPAVAALIERLRALQRGMDSADRRAVRTWLAAAGTWSGRVPAGR